MNIQRYLDYLNHRFIRSFSATSIPDEWFCPHCSRAPLMLKKNSLSYSETPVSLRKRKDPDWEISWIDYVFSCIFICPACHAETHAAGVGKLTEDGSSNPEDYHYKEIVLFIPKYFEPPLRLIRIPQECPDYIRKALEGAFSVAWADISAGCNKLRVATEKIVSDLDPSLTGTLHNRIGKLEDKAPLITKELMAIKWLGNDASHDDNLRECDLAFAFKIVENVLKSLFQEDQNQYNDLIEIVNSSKGPPAR